MNKIIPLLFSLLLFASPTWAQMKTNSYYGGEPLRAVVDTGDSGDNTLIAAVSGKSICVLGAFLVSAGTVEAAFQSDASGTAISGPITLTAGTGFVLPQGFGCWMLAVEGELLNLDLSDAINVGGIIVYTLLD